jgi:hypothetical protein
VHRFDPLSDERWAALLERHANASVFHTVQWLRALQLTYGYEPRGYTTSAPGSALKNGLVCCDVNSWLTGHRLVSVPFADHCEWLLDSLLDEEKLSRALEAELAARSLAYIEVRPVNPAQGGWTTPSYQSSYCLHRLDLTPSLDTLFDNCHRDSTQRKIRRAEREGLSYQEGGSPELLREFYRLMLLTRRRHLVPPQPIRWFRNLAQCFGGAFKVRVAFHGGQGIAAIVTLRHKDTLVYKYGGSDPLFHNVGAMHFLFWESIREAKADGLKSFDLGRSDWENPGLITFKDRWGAQRTTLTYSRLGPARRLNRLLMPAQEWKEKTARKLYKHLPASILRAAGELLYRHAG